MILNIILVLFMHPLKTGINETNAIFFFRGIIKKWVY